MEIWEATPDGASILASFNPKRAPEALWNRDGSFVESLQHSRPSRTEAKQSKLDRDEVRSKTPFDILDGDVKYNSGRAIVAC